MMRSFRKLQIFLASPGDVVEERGIVREVIEELNRTYAEELGIVLEVIGWETDAYPAYGGDGQSIVNQQIGLMTEYSLFIGVLASRFGTPTPRAGSGTEEEFERAVESFGMNGRPAIMLYFREAAETLTTAEQAAQKVAVLSFRDRVREKGLTWNYSTPEAFRRLLHRHLMRWLRSHTAGGRVPPEGGRSDGSPKEVTDHRVEPHTRLGSHVFQDRRATIQLVLETFSTWLQCLLRPIGTGLTIAEGHGSSREKCSIALGVWFVSYLLSIGFLLPIFRLAGLRPDLEFNVAYCVLLLVILAISAGLLHFGLRIFRIPSRLEDTFVLHTTSTVAYSPFLTLVSLPDMNNLFEVYKKLRKSGVSNIEEFLASAVGNLGQVEHPTLYTWYNVFSSTLILLAGIVLSIVVVEAFCQSYRADRFKVYSAYAFAVTVLSPVPLCLLILLVHVTIFAYIPTG